MKVRDYVNDMILYQKFAVEVEVTSVHCGASYYQTDGNGNAVLCETDPCENYVMTDTFYYSIPHVKCPYLEYEVRYFRIVDDCIILCINEIIEV